MATTRTRRRYVGIDYWPGFVDALSTLLLVVVFLLSVFALAQYFLSRDVTKKDDAITRLNKQLSELTELLSLERNTARGLQDSLTGVSATLDATKAEAARLQAQAAAARPAQGTSDLQKQVDSERSISARAAAQVEILNQQISALRKQLAALEQALNASENRDKESQTRITELGSRLNVALAQRVQELTRYRSDFFGRLRQILGSRDDIRVVGDRFLFQSEVLFDAGQASLATAGRPDLDRLATAVSELEREIPPDIAWILRVDGHTDRRPIQSAAFPSNWALSSSRAIAVVQYLVSKGVSPNRLAAAGFGEFQPIDPGETDDALRRNRRIELKLTER
jgi:chemotaxis protein MotB